MNFFRLTKTRPMHIRAAIGLAAAVWLSIAFGHSVNAQSKTRVEIKSSTLYFNGTELKTPFEMSELKKIFGEPDRTVQLANLISTWDHAGVMTYQDDDRAPVNQLNIVLNNTDDIELAFLPKTPFSGDLIIDGATVTQDLTDAQINKAKTGARILKNGPLGSLLSKMTSGGLTIYITRALKKKLTARGKIVEVAISPSFDTRGATR